MVRDALSASTASALFGPLEHGTHLVALSKGAVGFGEVVGLMLATAGAADLTLATWAAAPAELRALRRLLDAGGIRQLRLLIDPSFQRRQPAYCAVLRALFGPEAVRLVVSHLKLALVVNDAWALVLRSSANLNANHRLELFEVSDDRALARFLQARLAEWYPAPADQWDAGAAAHEAALADWRAADVGDRGVVETGEGRRGEPRRVMRPGSEGDRRYFSDDPFGIDVRRVGLTYVR